jgi:hypothetical protein
VLDWKKNRKRKNFGQTKEYKVKNIKKVEWETAGWPFPNQHRKEGKGMIAASRPTYPIAPFHSHSRIPPLSFPFYFCSLLSQLTLQFSTN